MERRSKVWKCIRKAGITVLAAVCIFSMGMTAGAAKNKFVKKSGKTYYYDAKGRKVSGLKKIKGKIIKNISNTYTINHKRQTI